VSASSAYDRLAPHYRAFSERRAVYLDAVDRYVIAHAARGARMLDVGSGDGVRACGIAQRIGALRLVLCEPSPAMAALCRNQNADAVWECAAETMVETVERFEVITCLWNVLGHLDGRLARTTALQRMHCLLAPQGRLFCDVNNRHNARAYGRARVILRRALDCVVPSEHRGDSAFEWNVGGERIAATGHLFTPREMQELVTAAGLDIEDSVTVDYATGSVSRNLRDGQLLYRLRARAALRKAIVQ